MVGDKIFVLLYVMDGLVVMDFCVCIEVLVIIKVGDKEFIKIGLVINMMDFGFVVIVVFWFGLLLKYYVYVV